MSEDDCLASARSWNIYIDSSGGIDDANAALPSGVGNTLLFSIIKKCFFYKYAMTCFVN